MDTGDLVLLLAAVPGIGDRAVARVLRRLAVLRRTPEEFLRSGAGELQDGYGLKRDAARAVHAITAADIEAACAHGRELRRLGVQVATVLDASYPARLVEQLQDPPGAVYLYGTASLLCRALFAVANSNGAPELAQAATDSAARIAVHSGMVPVTGTNRPAYQRPALVARRVGAPVCYVLDRGLLDEFGGHMGIEPVRAARVWQPTYDLSRDLTISPFAPRHHALAAHNRRRDEIVFALASCVLAGYVRPDGVMHSQCLAALRAGKPVFVAAGEAGAGGDLLEAGAVRLDPANEEAAAAALSAATTA